MESQSPCKPLLDTLDRRGAAVWRLDNLSNDSLTRLKEYLWKTDRHVILHGLLGNELKALRPIFEDRKNFSVLPLDWWNSPFWFSKNATFQFFLFYSGIAVRTGASSFVPGTRPPWLYIPDRRVRYLVYSALMRPAALAAAPFLDIVKKWQRMSETADARRLLYFPIGITPEQVPLQSESPRYDFTNIGATNGPWLLRDPYAPAWLNFANLYQDRARLTNLLVQFNGNPFTVFDRRRNHVFLPWEEVNRIVRQSRFMVCTGGLHQSSVPKFLEYACLGVPMIGETLPFEFGWLDDCLYPVDTMNISPAELKPKLHEALALYPKLRENCLGWRDRLLKMYHPETLLDMVQDQMDGKPVPPGYLKTPKPV